MIASVNEHHVGRGYDPYNSADQPHMIASRNQKIVFNAHVDALIRKGFRVLAREKDSVIFSKNFSKKLYRFTPPI